VVSGFFALCCFACCFVELGTIRSLFWLFIFQCRIQNFDSFFLEFRNRNRKHFETESFITAGDKVVLIDLLDKHLEKTILLLGICRNVGY